MSAKPVETPKPVEVVEQPSAKRIILDSALANVLDHARRLKMSSVEGVTDIFDKSSEAVEFKPPSVKAEVVKPKVGATRSRLYRKLQKLEMRPQTPRGVQCQTARLPLPPPPPPPSPRCPQAMDIFLALEQTKQLMDNYRQTDDLVDRLIEEATDMNREVIVQSQLQRELDLVRDMEVEYSEDYVYVMLEAIRAEFEGQDS